MGKKITIQGKVHNVGYRLLALEQADNLFIPFFDARNVKPNGKEELIIMIDGNDAQLNEFNDFINSNFPETAIIDNISIEEYSGQIKTIDKFRQSFDTVQLSKIVQSGLVLLKKQDELIVHTKTIEEHTSIIKEHTSIIKEHTSIIKEHTSIIKEHTSTIKEHTSTIKEQTKYIPEMRDTLQGIRDDTKDIKNSTREIREDIMYIRQETKEIKEDTKEIKEDTKEIKSNSYQTNQLLEEKFTKLENEVSKVKMALIRAGIEV